MPIGDDDAEAPLQIDVAGIYDKIVDRCEETGKAPAKVARDILEDRFEEEEAAEEEAAEQAADWDDLSRKEKIEYIQEHGEHPRHRGR